MTKRAQRCHLGRSTTPGLNRAAAHLALLGTLGSLLAGSIATADDASPQMQTGEPTAARETADAPSRDRRPDPACVSIDGRWGVLITHGSGFHTEPSFRIDQRDCEFTARTDAGPLFSGSLSGSRMTISGSSAHDGCPFSYNGSGRFLDHMFYLTYREDFRPDCGPSIDVAIIGTRSP